MRLIDSFVESQTTGDLLICRIVQHRGAATNQNGQIINRKSKPIEYFLNLGITFEIDVGIGLVIASQKLLNTQNVERVTGANQNDIAKSPRN